MFILSLTSCYHDNEEELYAQKALSQNTICDTTNVTYTNMLKPIFDNNCTGCHGSSASTNGGGYDLRTYDNVKQNIDKIIGCITYQSGYNPMPKGGSKFEACRIKQFTIWKQQGFIQ